MRERIRRRSINGGGGSGIVAVERNTPAAYGEGGPTTNSLTLSAIDSDLNVTINVSEGDVLLVSFVGTVGTNSGPETGKFNYSVDGVPQFDDDLEALLASVDSELISYTDLHVVTAGEITGGQVTLIPLWASNSAAIQLPPTFSVANLGSVG